MECNKEEAIRAKEIAEKKFLEKDIRGARKITSKAQSLYPELEGISQMLETLDIYAAAENKINGEADWYRILGVNPRADYQTVRKRYRKLALTLHPDKNKSVGAEGAFKLLSEAWTVLSDKGRRTMYDQKNAKVFGSVSAAAGASSSSKVSNGFHNFAKSSMKATTKSHNSSQHPTYVPASAPKSKANTFWTVCHRCKMQYEYLRVYLNHNLLCPNCRDPFLAVETPPPPSSGIKQWKKSQQRSGSNHQHSTASTQGKFHWSPFSKTGNVSTAAQAATVVQQAYEKVRREREEAQAATKREEAHKRKYNASKRMGISSNYAKKRRGMEDFTVTNQKVSGNVANMSGSSKSPFMRDVSEFEIQTELIKKADMEIRKKINEWKSRSGTEVSIAEAKEDCKETCSKDLEMQDQINSGMCAPTNRIGSVPDESLSRAEVGSVKRMTVMVPDPDFHDFEKDRMERCFKENQVWAAYDDDGMPRYYALIQSVISLNPFQMRIRWLHSKTNTELGPLKWLIAGFSKTCGEFRLGRYEICNSVGCFSHEIGGKKTEDGITSIYPRKGEVWALYRNWSPGWNELTAYEVIHQYDMVEVLEDYNEEQGAVVIPLVKVARFKTVFHQHLDPREARRIPKEEMFRFSHRVPSHLVSGQGLTTPKDCLELDPAATPTELLQVIMDAKEEDILEKEEALKREMGSTDNLAG